MAAAYCVAAVIVLAAVAMVAFAGGFFIGYGWGSKHRECDVFDEAPPRYEGWL